MMNDTLLECLVNAVEGYELSLDDRYRAGTYFACMDTSVDKSLDSVYAFAPDISNRFRSLAEAIEYCLEEGAPIWLVRTQARYPQDYFTRDKLEFLFDEYL